MTIKTAKPDLLVFGPETGVTALSKHLKSDLPDLCVAESLCDASLPTQEIRHRLARAVAQYNPREIMLASHTLSLIVDDSGLPPVHRMLAPLAEAARLTCTHSVALLAQPQLIDHPATRRQIALYGERGLRVTPFSLAELAYMAHRYIKEGHLPDLLRLRDLMTLIRDDARIDTVVLATTNASVLRGILEKAAFRPFYWVDGIAITARKYKDLRADRASLASRA